MTDTKMVSLRLPEPLLEWATSYAEQRGVSRTDLLASALESFREDCEAGVPELRRVAAEQSSVRDPRLEAGVGVCPKRLPGLGHVWESAKVDSTRPCVHCGALGRARRDKSGNIVEPGYFEQATKERAELFSRLHAPQSVRGTTRKEA